MMIRVPSDWQLTALGDCCVVNGEYGANSPSVPFDESLPRYIRITDINDNGRLNSDTIVSVPIDGNERYILQDGDFLFARSGATVGKTYRFKLSDGWAIYAGYLIRFRTDESKLTVDYLQHYTQSDEYRTWVKNSLRAGAQPNINATEYATLVIPLPPLPEQRAIAAILSTWDEAITLTTRLIDALKRRKQALMQLLLTGKVRFPGFDGEWEEVEIGKFLKESREPGNSGVYARKLTVKLYGKGVTRKENARGGSENTQYYRRRAGQFIYSKLDFLNGAFGIIPKELDGFESTLDLPAFDWIEDIIPDYFLAFVSREAFYSQFTVEALGGRKARRIPVEAFLGTPIPLPNVFEQTKISSFFRLLSVQLSRLETYLEMLETQKRGLMQQLLTGAVRVRVEEDGLS